MPGTRPEVPGVGVVVDRSVLMREEILEPHDAAASGEIDRAHPVAQHQRETVARRRVGELGARRGQRPDLRAIRT